MAVKFGPAGNDESFHGKSNLEIPDFVLSLGLNAYEYQCGRGVHISEENARGFGEACKSKKISLSLHTPYFISLSSVEEEKRDNSINYIVQSAVAAVNMGAKRIVVHSGSCGKISRVDALCLACGTVKKALAALDERNLDVTMCLETMGKINQLGTLEEVLEMCRIDERLLPCIDFGHLNARTLGEVNSIEAYESILDKLEDALGHDRAKIFHSHFSKIMYTENGGEKKHLTFEDAQYGPQFEPLMELVYKRNLTPVFICESAGTQARDAAQMCRYYKSMT